MYLILYIFYVFCKRQSFTRYLVHFDTILVLKLSKLPLVHGHVVEIASIRKLTCKMSGLD